MSKLQPKERKTVNKSTVKFNALDLCVIIALIAVLGSVLLRFIPLDKLTESRKNYTVTLKITNVDLAVIEASGIKEGDQLTTSDGAVLGTVVSVEKTPSVLGISDAGEKIVYPEGTVYDLKIGVSCVLTASSSGTYSAGKEPVTAGAGLKIYGHYYEFDSSVLTVVQN